MKKAVLLLVLMIGFGAYATQAQSPAPQTHPQTKPAEPTLAELKLKVAEQDVTIANLRQQLIAVTKQYLQMSDQMNSSDLEKANAALKAEQDKASK